MKTQYIINKHDHWFVIEDSEPLTHEELQSHSTYKDMVSTVAERIGAEYNDLLNLEFTINNKGGNSFSCVDGRGCGEEYKGIDLLNFIVKFEI